MKARLLLKPGQPETKRLKKKCSEALLRARKIRMSFGKKTFSDSAELLREDHGR